MSPPFEPFSVTVAGEAAVSGGSGEKAWKEQVLAAVKEQTDPSKLGPPLRQALAKAWAATPRLPLRQDCTLEVKFYLSSLKVHQQDLDNLLKPAIDALGTAIFPPGGRGSKYDSEDVWVRKIVAEKLVDNKNPRLEIRVSPWTEA